MEGGSSLEERRGAPAAEEGTDESAAHGDERASWATAAWRASARRGRRARRRRREVAGDGEGEERRRGEGRPRG